MAQLKDTLIQGNLRVVDKTYSDTLYTKTIFAPDSSSSTTTQSQGSNGNVLKSNGTNTYWGTVSKSDIGLSNVENTALSTWTGSSNITTIGTISSGTWNGTAISANKLPTASTTAKGIVQIGTGLSITAEGVLSADTASIKTLDTTATTSQATSSSETISGSGTITLHKIAKTGAYADLIDPPTIPTSFNITVSDNILDGTGGANSVSYAPYSSKGAGHLYTGTTAPSSTNRLNYDGYFYATKLYSNNAEVLTSHQTMYYRPIKVDGVEKLSNTSSTALNLVAGDAVTLTENTGAVTITAQVSYIKRFI